MIFYRVKTGSFYIGVKRWLLWIASPSLTDSMFAVKPVENCFWINRKSFHAEQRKARVALDERWEQQNEVRNLVDDALGIKPAWEQIVEILGGEEC